MNLSNFRGKIARLWVVLVIAIAYLVWMLHQPPLVHHTRFVGSMGILGGLYVCSHPAAFFVDLIFLRRSTIDEQLQGVKGITWFVINLVTFLLGCLMITIGAIRFV